MYRPARDGGCVFDLGANTIPHERLFLQTVRPSIATPDRIESSADGAAWQPLTPEEPFRAEAGERWISTSYPVTGARWLRLHWPARVGRAADRGGRGRVGDRPHARRRHPATPRLRSRPSPAPSSAISLCRPAAR